MDFRTTTLPDLVADVTGRRVSSRELVERALARIEELNPRVNAFVAVDADAALAAADAVDRRVAGGDDVGPLAGIPIGVKDLEDAVGFVTTSGSATHAQDPVATCDSVLVTRLKDAGAVVIGKTNTPEFGLKPQTDNPTFGITRNPWDLERTPGGSSGGTSAALASGMVPLATGSDGGGSIRIPSSVTGLSGLKPSLGRVPSGDVGPPGWQNLTTRGVMARRIRDVAYALDVVVGPHPRDQRSLPREDGRWFDAVRDPTPPRRVAWSPTLGYATVDSGIRAVCEAAVRKLESAGTEVVELDAVFHEDPTPYLGALVSTYTRRTIMPFRDTPMWSKLDPFVVLASEMSATGVSAVDLVEAEDACHRVNLQLVDVLADVDVVLCPTTCGVMPLASMPATVDELLAKLLADATDLDVERLTAGLDLDRIVEWLRGLGELNFPRGTIDGEQALDWTRLTQPFNMTRSPAGTVCAGFTGNGLPIGLQVVGPQHGDVTVLRTVAFLEDLLALDTVAPI
jgi:Asp-tRNA(Asn)/Glu-tRNA(Gln) amidotransferase A subunit family amidase